LKEIIDPPNYIFDYAYSDFDKSNPNLNLTYDKENNKNSAIVPSISVAMVSQRWSTEDDPVLRDYGGGAIRGGPEVFNPNGFRADGKSEPVYFGDTYKKSYLKYQNYADSQYTKYAFWAEDQDPQKDKLVENPYLKIENWEVVLKDLTGQENQDLEMKTENIHDGFSDALDHNFQAKLKYYAKERRIVKLTGLADSAYELMYFDGSKWIKFAQGNPGNGHFTAFWDVGRLCGKYTVLLKTLHNIASQDIYIGDLVYCRSSDPENRRVTSAYKRAELQFNKDSFKEDQFSSVTPVSMTEIYIRNKPIIKTHGPIVELMPSPITFVSSVKPSLKFLYTADDLKEGYGIAISSNDWKNNTQDLTIHQVTANGDLQIVDDQKKYSENDPNTGSQYFVFEAALDHFSDYALLNGKFQLSAPIVYADRYITNKDSVTIYGTAEPDSVVTVYVKEENVVPEIENAEPYEARQNADVQGNFRFEGVRLKREGENYLFVTSHLAGNKDIRTYSDLTIVEDTIPPSVEASANLYAFSPNGDGKYDSVDYMVKTNEKASIYLGPLMPGSQGALFNEEISAEPNIEYKINWAENNVRIYQPGTTTNWTQIEERALPSTYPDGEYLTTVYAIDRAGNISENIINKTIVDTKPPVIQKLAADPNPFTPNDDQVKDTTTFNYEFSEPAYVTLKVNRDDGALFRKYEGPTEKFSYPTSWNRDVQSQVPSSGDWTWDGRGSRNELIGGEYAYLIAAEDWVGNTVSSESKTIVVDRAPSLIPYAFAEPDPFSPVNPENSYTEIKYYLGRDNLNVSVSIQGEGSSEIKSLVRNEVQNKGEHSARWYGDFASGYSGPTAIKNQYRVGDGSYEFNVFAQDPDGGQPANVTNTVLVDNTPPNIVAKPVQVDYTSKKAALEYNIPENASVEVEVYAEDGSLITTLVTAEAKSPGDYSLEYDFTSETENIGKKYFKIIAVDRAKNIAEKITETFAIVANEFQISNHYVSPSTFTPNGDGLTDLTTLKYIISGGVPDYIVNIDIQTQTGSTIKTLVNDEPQSAGTYSYSWDGYNDSKQLTSDGYYQYAITVKDKLGAEIGAQGSIIVVSTRPTVNASIDPAIFSPNGDNSKDTATITYSIAYPVAYITGEALVKLEVLNASSEAVWSKIFNNTAGTYSYEYSGE
ncbi:MAG: hypothetical protein KJ732_00795, partial [Candidatus Margulisbacteria bacterium]|nr:hypothetical protein [Candidatus Margulisiibacteriota bacterium]